MKKRISRQGVRQADPGDGPHAPLLRPDRAAQAELREAERLPGLHGRRSPPAPADRHSEVHGFLPRPRSGGLLDGKGYEAVKSLRVQAAAVRDEIARLREASRAIDQVLARLEKDGRIHKQKLIKIMEVIQMGEDVKKGWHEKYLLRGRHRRNSRTSARTTPPRRWSPTRTAGRRSSPRSRRTSGSIPASDKAQDLGRRWTELFDEVYGGHPDLKTKIAAAYSAGAIPKEHNMIAPEVWDFIKKVHAAATTRG